MGAKRFKIEFTDLPVNNDHITFRVYYDGDLMLLYNYQFHTSSTIIIGEDIAEQLVFLRAHLQFIFNSVAGLEDVTMEISGDILYIYFGNNTIDVTGGWINTIEGAGTPVQSGTYSYADLDIEDYEYEEPEPGVPVVLEDANVLSRSPYWFRYAPGISFDQIVAKLYIYNGHKDDDRPTTPTITLSKYVVNAGQSLIAFDIQGIVNDYVKNKYTEFTFDYLNPAPSASPSPAMDSTWCFIDADVKLAGEVLGTVEQLLFCVDGYGYHSQGFNPAFGQNILSSIDSHIYYSGDYLLYFLTEGLDSITVNGTNVPFTFDQDYNNQKVGYVNVAAYIDTEESWAAEFVYGTGEDAQTITHNFTRKTECRYPVYNCIFKNKFGFWQSIPFTKRSKGSLDRTSSEYQGNITNYGQYDTIEHVDRTYMVNAKEKITLNTDFMPEDYNLLFKELFLSEFVYLQNGRDILPVTLGKNSFEFKTRLFDKMIQYTMDFKYANDLMNTAK